MSEAPVPPNNPEAEEAVLGACLLGAIDVCADILEPGDFYRQSHGDIFGAALALHAKGDPVDHVTLSAALPAQEARIHEIARVVPVSANAGHYSAIVKRCAVSRGLVTAGGEIARLGYEQAEDALEQTEALVYELGQTRAQGAQADLPGTVRSVVDELLASDGKPARELLGVGTGLLDLDKVTRGFRDGDLVVVAAGTGRGKSALWLNAALHMLRLGKPVAAFSLEMSEAELVNRALALESGIPHDRITRGDIRPNEWSNLTAAAEFLVQAPLALWTDATIRPSGLRSQLRRWKARNPDGAFVVVDYLQLMTPDEKSDNRVVDVSSISRSLKVTAMTLGLPVLAVSQLHRIEPNQRPHKGNLRESGSIENDASVVILVHRTEAEPNVAELIVDKNRHGATDSVKTKWTGELMRFSNLISEARAAA